MENIHNFSSQYFFDNENDLLCISEDLNTFNFVSAGWEKVLGWSLEELNKAPVDDLIHPDDWEKTKEFLILCQNQDRLYGFENRYITKSREIRWLRWRVCRDKDRPSLHLGMATDITESKEQFHFHTLSQKQGKLGNWSYHKNSEKLTWSEEVYRIYELESSSPPTFAEQTSFYEDVHGKRLQSAIQDCLENGIPWDFELELVTQKGNIKWIRSWGFPRKIGAEITGAEGLIQDLTHKKNEELILKQTVEELDKIQVSINQHCLVARLNSFGYFMDANAIFLDSMEYSLSEVLGTQMAKMIQSPDYAVKFQTIHELLRKGEKWRGEFLFHSRSGKAIYLDMSLTPVMDISQKKLHEIVCISYDITDKKLNDERYQILLQAIDAGIWDWPDINHPKKYWSPKLYEILHYRPDEIEPTDAFFKSIVHPEDLEMVTLGQSRMILQDEPLFQEFRVLCGNGKYKWIQTMGIVVRDENNRPTRIIGSTIDIDQKKLFERKLEEEKQKSIQASKLATLGEMAAGLAHEVNNPLTIIFGYIRVLEEDMMENKMSYDHLHKHLGLIKKAAERAANIVTNLKDFARDGSNDPFEDSRISQLVNMVLDLCRERFKKNGIQMELELGEDPLVYCRKIEFSQVILNLLFNSFDAIHELEEKWVRITARKNENLIELDITDSGRGLRPEVAEKIFTPFFTTKKLGLGTGLGLSISKRIILNHGGDIFYDRTSENTRFVLKLPLYYELK